MTSEHENPTIRAWADAALELLGSWEVWPSLRTEMRTTVLMLEIEGEQLFAKLVESGRDPAEFERAAESLAIMAAHWWATEGRRLDVDERR